MTLLSSSPLTSSSFTAAEGGPLHLRRAEPLDDAGQTSGIIVGSIFGVLALFALTGLLLAYLSWRQKQARREAIARGERFIEDDGLSVIIGPPTEEQSQITPGRMRRGVGDEGVPAPTAVATSTSTTALPIGAMGRGGTAHNENGGTEPTTATATTDDAAGAAPLNPANVTLTGVAIENRIRPRNQVPRGTVVVRHENQQIRIDFSQLPEIPEAEGPPLTEEEMAQLEWEMNRVASPEFYGRAEYLQELRNSLCGTPHFLAQLRQNRHFSSAASDASGVVNMSFNRPATPGSVREYGLSVAGGGASGSGKLPSSSSMVEVMNLHTASRLSHPRPPPPRSSAADSSSSSSSSSSLSMSRSGTHTTRSGHKGGAGGGGEDGAAEPRGKKNENGAAAAATATSNGEEAAKKEKKSHRRKQVYHEGESQGARELRRLRLMYLGLGYDESRDAAGASVSGSWGGSQKRPSPQLSPRIGAAEAAFTLHQVPLYVGLGGGGGESGYPGSVSLSSVTSPPQEALGSFGRVPSAENLPAARHGTGAVPPTAVKGSPLPPLPTSGSNSQLTAAATAASGGGGGAAFAFTGPGAVPNTSSLSASSNYSSGKAATPAGAAQASSSPFYTNGNGVSWASPTHQGSPNHATAVPTIVIDGVERRAYGERGGSAQTSPFTARTQAVEGPPPLSLVATQDSEGPVYTKNSSLASTEPGRQSVQPSLSKDGH